MSTISSQVSCRDCDGRLRSRPRIALVQPRWKLVAGYRCASGKSGGGHVSSGDSCRQVVGHLTPGFAKVRHNPVNLRGSLYELPRRAVVSRTKKDPLRPLTNSERRSLEQLARSQSAPALSVARARALLAVSDGSSYTDAAH